MIGKGFLVKCKEDMEVYKELPNKRVEVVFFKYDTLYTAINDKNEIAVIDRSSRNVRINLELFNRHFNLIG